MLSNPSKYAIRALLFLASEASNTQKLSPSSISDKMNISTSFLANILQTLAKKKDNILC